MKKRKPYQGMVLFTVLALLSIYFIVVFQFIGFYRNQQRQLNQLIHFYEMKTLVNLSYRRMVNQRERQPQQLTFNIGNVLFQPKEDEWCFEVILNTGEKRRFYKIAPKLADTEETKKQEMATETTIPSSETKEFEKTSSTESVINQSEN